LDENLSLKNTRKEISPENSVQFIRCKCGFEIPFVPDAKAMGKSIQDHSLEHAKKEKNPAKAAFEETRIQNQLISQTIDKTTS
jgi:hypothetical protein